MKRHLISITAFVAAVILLLAIGLAAHDWLVAALVAAALIVGGLIFFRRGK